MPTQSLDNNKRIAKNTLLLYFRMLFNLLVTLYTSRVILQALGVEDMGIYNVVGGIVTMSQVVTSSISNAISRFLTFELGTGNFERLRTTFSVSVTVLIFLSVIIFLVAEFGGLYFIDNVLYISTERIVAAKYVLLFSTLTFCINMISVPYNASIISHENMNIYAYVGIFETIMKLMVAYAITFFSSCDRLILYALFLFSLALIIRVFYGIYCSRTFAECHYSFVWDKKTLKELLGFASWTFWGDMANVFKSQGVSMLVNVFFGATINAAQAIANQVSNAIQQFSNNFITAVSPQIIKQYAAREFNEMTRLVSKATRFSFYITILIAFPILINLDNILKVWLKIVPDNTASFIRLIVLYIFVDILSQPMLRMINATGQVKRYQIGISIIMFLNFPLSYILLKWNFGPNAIYWVALFTGLMAFAFRLNTVKRLFPALPFCMFCKKMLLGPCSVIVISLCIYVSMCSFSLNPYLKLLFSFFIGELSLVLFIYMKGMSESERLFLKRNLKKW